MVCPETTCGDPISKCRPRQHCDPPRGLLYRWLPDACRPDASTRSLFGRRPITLNECGGSGQAIGLPLLWVEPGGCRPDGPATAAMGQFRRFRFGF